MKGERLHPCLLLVLVTVVSKVSAFPYFNRPPTEETYYGYDILEKEDDWRQGQLSQALCILQNCVPLRGSERYHCIHHTCSAAAAATNTADQRTIVTDYRVPSTRHHSPSSLSSSSSSSSSISSSYPLMTLEGARSKRWQYSDPLQVCIAAHCTGQRGAPFYQCVFKQCIMNPPAPMVLGGGGGGGAGAAASPEPVL